MQPERAWLLVFVIVVSLGRLLAQRQRRLRGPTVDRWRALLQDPSAVLLSLVVALVFGLSVAEGVAWPPPQHPVALRLIGLGGLVLGFAVAGSANRQIGESWSPSVEKSQEQQLVTSGPYARVRHPLYLAGLLILAGTDLYLGCWRSTIAAVLSLPLLALRIWIEERRLVEHFGEAYRTYQGHTKALIPWGI